MAKWTVELLTTTAGHGVADRARSAAAIGAAVPRTAQIWRNRTTNPQRRRLDVRMSGSHLLL
jgi:hypothetical protein